MQGACKVAVTGALGQIAYSLIFRIASGQLLGSNQKIILSLLDVAGANKSAEGLIMELHDCAFPLLESVSYSSDPYEGFKGADIAILIGAKPRGPGMERVELLKTNGKIFIDQGKALGEVASKEVKVLVVGNPCNTNALICMHHAKGINKNQFSCMTMLDQHRAEHQIALKAGVDITAVTNLAVWGNHSLTQVPDFSHALIEDKPMASVILDHAWMETEFLSAVRERGSKVIDARGKSSAASAANAIVDHIRAMMVPTEDNRWFSSGVYSEKNPYGVEEGLFFSFPLTSAGNGQWSFVEGLTITPFLAEQIKASEKELINEREMVKHLLEN
ncbi:malate dehydrogenase [Candidatus Aerophobetes bacterium]|uniref:Malate dehydrogenase n=1 Tax=Aerophobetes bacterium TaxID=2030807 RepID=A0A2A4X615_UNCAE|nr:MAG: malate dehydrogenase [Candidatus Aerophobetes bacterium]